MSSPALSVGCTSLGLPVGGWLWCRSWDGSSGDRHNGEGTPSKLSSDQRGSTSRSHRNPSWRFLRGRSSLSAVRRWRKVLR